MKHFTIFFAIAILLTSCANVTAGSQTLSQVKAELNCIEYTKGIDWKQISERFGTPDKTPLPEPGSDLKENTRLYKDKIIIFHTEIQEVKEGDRVRFYEVVIKIEVCREK